MPLYQITPEKKVSRFKPTSFSSERDLQRFFEKNLQQLLGVRFIATEFTTGDRQRGRIDTLGLDEDGFPTIIEYKKTRNENIINQGLFYLDWLVDHKGDFTLITQEALRQEVQIDWSSPRLILVAESFSEYDKYAVNRIGANVELWTYRRYGNDLLLLDPLFATNPQQSRKGREAAGIDQGDGEELEVPTYTVEDHLEGKSHSTIVLFEQLREAIFSLGDDEAITEKANKLYVSYKHGKNFCEVKVQAQGLKMWLDIVYEDLNDPQGLGKDVTSIGHHGTGSVEVRLTSDEHLSSVVDLIAQAYQQTI
ncbi:MAG: DUF5655 domain-containing protein [Anaerolineae bacterium]|nr:DUF5655 domain-containing protein [Anaerolineae bacterium]